MKTQQDMAIAQQRLALARAGQAMTAAAHRRSMLEAANKEEFEKNHKQVNGVWWDKQPDGTWAESKTLNMYDANGKMIGVKTDLGTYNEKLGGYVGKDGTFTPLQLPEGYTPPNAKSDDFLDLGQAGETYLRDLTELDLGFSDLKDSLDKVGDKYTGLVVGNLPTYEPEANAIRAAMGNFTSQIRKAMSGVSVSPAEMEQLKEFLPSKSDTWGQIQGKMAAYQAFIDNKIRTAENMYGPRKPLQRLPGYARVHGAAQSRSGGASAGTGAGTPAKNGYSPSEKYNGMSNAEFMRSRPGAGRQQQATAQDTYRPGRNGAL